MARTVEACKKLIATNRMYIQRLAAAGKPVPQWRWDRLARFEAELAALIADAKEVIAVPVRAAPVVAEPVTTTAEWYNPSAGVEGTPQAAALAAADEPYIAAGYGQSGVWLPGFTPNSARAWWAEWFAKPFDMRLVDPAALPGSLVLSAEQGARAVALNKTVLPPPPAYCAGVPCPPNPNLYEGSPTLEAIRSMQASGNPSFPPFAPGVTFPVK